MKVIKLYIALLTAMGFIYSCTSPAAKKTAAHQVSFFKGSSNNKLEVLDWGGTGKPIIFLTGMGNSAHVFDDFAPQFTDQFHVYALTRRGFGASEQPAAGYDMDLLVRDIVVMIDSLHLNKVTLIGHSIAGEEITKFASAYPDRVDKIIYLDAAYDNILIGSLATNPPEAPKATAGDSSSFERIQQFIQRTNGISYPDEETKNICIFSGEGKYVKDVTPDSIYGEIFKGVEHPDSGYMQIKCPALAIYAGIDSVKQCFYYYSNLDAPNKGKADSTFIIIQNWSREEHERFKKAVKNGKVEIIRGANHYIFLSNPAETGKKIREFLQ